jgi:prepilin-type N-terminal cleavage/methylation domain-containing protein
MPKTNSTRRGFTLIELLFVVAIIGILATTAIGLFQQQQVRAKRTEAMTNLSAIAKMQNGYFGENGGHPVSIPVPLGFPGSKQAWDAASTAAFGTIGFSTDGSVYYVYDVNSPAPGGSCACPSGDCFTASAYGDSDKDTHLALVGYFHADSTGAACASLVMAAIGPPINPVDGLPILEQPVDIFQYSGPVVDDY